MLLVLYEANMGSANASIIREEILVQIVCIIFANMGIVAEYVKKDVYYKAERILNVWSEKKANQIGHLE
jgi:hypothetical protein